MSKSMAESKESIKQELARHGLKMTGANFYPLGTGLVAHVGAYGDLADSPFIKPKLEWGNNSYQNITNIMHDDLVYLAPETTEVAIVDPGDNKEGKTYLVFIFSDGG
jgi:hypothetical protein